MHRRLLSKWLYGACLWRGSSSSLHRLCLCLHLHLLRLATAYRYSHQLREAGYTAVELKIAGFQPTKLKKAGFTEAEVKEALLVPRPKFASPQVV